MYKTVYNWSSVGYPGFSTFLENLYQKSYYIDSESSINRFLNHIENYFYELIRMGFVNINNFHFILNRLETIKKVDLLPKELHRHYALVKDNIVYLNPSIKGEHGLSSSSFSFMVDSHELGHIINHGWETDALYFCDSMKRVKDVKEILRDLGLTTNHLFYGFQLIDEVATQEVAERVTYQAICKNRPKIEKRTDKRIFNFKPYMTNYSIYGEFQTIVEEFARQLDFLNCKNDDSLEVLKKLSIESFSPKFIKKIEDELYNNPDKIYPFIVMLGIMGKIKEVTYQLIENNKEKEELDVTSYVSIFNKIVKDGDYLFTYQKK